MKKLIFSIVTMLMSMAATTASAYDAYIDGIYYELSGTKATVTSGDDLYSGSVAIPSSVTYQGRTYSVTSIGEGAFADCSGLTSIEIPNSITSIGFEAFYQCTGLTSIEIPNSVTSIEKYVFIYCTGLTNIRIPNSITSIGEYAFKDCTGLTSIDIPNSVTSIEYTAFNGCSGLSTIKVENGNTVYDSRNNCNAIIETSTNALMWGCKNTIIPDNVTSIKSDAFFGCTGLTSIEIPNSVTSIGEGAFASCSGLSTIKVENGNTVYDSRNNCNAIIKTSTNVLICGCKNTIIPDNVTAIGNYAFYGCAGLTSIVIPNSTTFIGKFAFSGCTGLTSIEIPDGVTDIRSGTFSGCTGLTFIIIPDGVTVIDRNAFYGCTGLKDVIIGSGVEFIGSNAFGNCKNIERVASLIEKPFKINSSVFSNESYANATLYIPEGTLQKYQATAAWNQFQKIVEGYTMPDEIKTVSLEEQENVEQIYTPGGKRVDDLQKGLNIVVMKDGTAKKIIK